MQSLEKLLVTKTQILTNVFTIVILVFSLCCQLSKPKKLSSGSA